MDTRRSFLKKASILSGGAGMLHVLPESIAKAMAIDPAPGSTYLDAEHVVLLMQENRSFDHTYGTLQGVRGFNDPRAISLPNNNLVWLQSNKKGETYAPFRFDIKNTKITWMDSLPHAWSDQVDARNNGKYDKWLDAKPSGKEEYNQMPLTLGYYTRADIPFYYSLADAFTICDQHFCSSLTGTTPNRLYFWTGTIREKADASAIARVWNGDADYDTMVNWKTFPERLEENGVPWKIYQNEISVGVGFNEEEDAWLANFGDNPIEYFKQFNVKLSPEYIANIPKAIRQLEADIKKRQDRLPTLTGGNKESEDIKGEIEWLKKRLAAAKEDQMNCTVEKFEQLSEHQKSLHRKAFSTNKQDPFYHQLTTLKYKDGDTERELNIPRGDILHEFRQDVNNGKLPAVSWIVAPQNFSDHPSSAWYGAWYISEVMDILTKNPEIWKKTIFILTYDENDGYFDHVPPFVAPHPSNKETGFVSNGIDTSIDYVANNDQQSQKDQARESSIGLGYRVPLVIASPWSRGGWVNSQVFDLTSSLQFLEKFLSHKFGKKIEEPNISKWRRTICGDLDSVFRPYSGEKLDKPEFLDKKEFIESIHKAQFKNVPSNYKILTNEVIDIINRDPHGSQYLPVQEKGIRSSCPLPYELFVDGDISTDKQTFVIRMKSANQNFQSKTAGCPFQIYAPGIYKGEKGRSWQYAVAAGDTLEYSWEIRDFENQLFQLRVYGPNGFYREFKGDQNNPKMGITAAYRFESNAKKQLKEIGVSVVLFNSEQTPQEIVISDNAYGMNEKDIVLGNSASRTHISNVPVNLKKSHGWYDFTVRIKGNSVFEQRYAGRVETGLPGKTDPFMGRMV